jgi:hypothetical protein
MHGFKPSSFSAAPMVLLPLLLLLVVVQQQRHCSRRNHRNRPRSASSHPRRLPNPNSQPRKNHPQLRHLSVGSAPPRRAPQHRRAHTPRANH